MAKVTITIEDGDPKTNEVKFSYSFDPPLEMHSQTCTPALAAAGEVLQFMQTLGQ